MNRRWSILGVALLAVLAGCLGTGGDGDDLDAQSAEDVEERAGLPNVSETVERVVQVEDRWSGEPSILALDDGTLLITGAGGFSRYIEDPTDAPGHFGQSYIWRSTDDGETWDLVDIETPGPTDEYTPYRNAVPGVEGDLSQDEGGRAYFVDLSMLATNGVSASDDSGETWLAAQSAAGLPATDRPWITGAGEDEVYVKYLNTNTGYRVAHSTDGGQTFLADQSIPACSQADPALDPGQRLVVPCVGGENGTDLSVLTTPTGEAMDWQRTDAPDSQGRATNVFPSLSTAGEGRWTFTYSEAVNGTTRVMAMTTTDAGETWSDPVQLSATNGSAVFPWTSANEDGTVSVVWYEAEGQALPHEQEDAWYPMHASFSLEANATTLERAEVTRVAEDPNHEGPICVGGLGCVLEGRSDERRLLDFFEVDVDADGVSHVSWTDTTTDVPTIWYGQVDPAEG